MVGLDTSHAVAFARLLHDERHPYHVPGARVTVAFPGGSPDFGLSASRVESFTREMAETFGVRIVESPERVAEACDAVMLEAADGRVHLEWFRRIAPYGKPVFIDKPLATNSRDAEEIIRLAERCGVPVMSSSALRFAGELAQALTPDGMSPGNGSSGGAMSGGASACTPDPAVTGADVFGPMPFQPPQPGYFWYGIHAAEMLFAVLGRACVQVCAIAERDHDVIIGTWEDGRIGTVRGNRTGNGAFGALIHCPDRSRFVALPGHLMPMYAAMLGRVLDMFRTGRPAVEAEETLAVIRFLEAANESRASGGTIVRL